MCIRDSGNPSYVVGWRVKASSLTDRVSIGYPGADDWHAASGDTPTELSIPASSDGPAVDKPPHPDDTIPIYRDPALR